VARERSDSGVDAAAALRVGSRWRAELAVATLLAAEGTQLALASQSGLASIAAKAQPADLVTEIDLTIERQISARLLEVFPDDSQVAEEGTVVRGRSGRTWQIDPLDGTSNFVVGLPTFGTCLSLVDDGSTVVAAGYSSLGATLFYAALDLPTTFSGGLETIAPLRPTGAIALVQSYSSIGDARVALLRASLEQQLGRVLSTWSPIADFALLVGGGIEAIINLHPSGLDWQCVAFLAARAGLAIRQVHVPEGAAQVVARSEGEISNVIASTVGQFYE
jgi:myo-inositol-1(or 4)-monophosphatase